MTDVFERRAEDIECTAWDGWPRKIDVRVCYTEQDIKGLSVKQAEGLYWALGKLIEDVRRADEWVKVQLPFVPK